MSETISSITLTEYSPSKIVSHGVANICGQALKQDDRSAEDTRENQNIYNEIEYTTV